MDEEVASYTPAEPRTQNILCTLPKALKPQCDSKKGLGEWFVKVLWRFLGTSWD